MSYVGDFRLGDTFDVKFCTVTTTGAPTALSSGTVVAYPGNSTTEVTAGITLSADFDGRTGLNNVRVVATSGNGYATATNYQLVLSVGTVGGTSVVGYVVAEFSIENRSAVMPTTAARTLDVSASGEAGVDWSNVGSPTTTLDLSNTTIKSTQKVDVDTIKTNPVVNGGTITFPTTATLASTTNITAGTVTTATNVTTVNGLAANVITAAAIADAAIDRATFAADTGLQSVRSNTAQAGANGSITLDASASATDGFYTDAYVYLTGSTGVGQCRLISGYTGASKVATVTPNWSVNPDNTTTFAILPFGRVDVGFWLGAIVNALISGRVDSNTQAIANAVITSSTLAADTLTAAKVASDVTDEIWGKACTEPTAVVGANPTVVQALSWLLTLSRNLITQTATTQTLKADDGSTTIATSAVADDGTTFSRAEWS